MADKAYYEPTPATDVGGERPAAENSVFEVFELWDTAFTNPLPLQTVALTNGAPLRTTAQGVMPGVYVLSESTSHIFRSGDWVWRRNSFTAAEEAIEEARAAAERAAAAAEAPADDAVNQGMIRAGVPLRIVHGSDANYLRPTYSGPVDWYGSVTPANRRPGDTYFLVASEPAPWAPDQLSNLQGWYKPNEGGYAAGASVAEVADHSGRGRVLRVTAGTLQYQPTGLANSGGLAFTGSQLLATDAFAATGIGPITVFMVAKGLNEVAGTTSNSGNFYDGHANGTMGFYRSGTTTVKGFGFRRSTTIGGAAGSTSDGDAHVFVITYDEAKSSIEIDGNLYFTGTTGNESITRLTLGGRPDGTNKLNGMIGEFFWKVGTVGNTTKAQAVAYLKAKAGMQ